MVFRNFQSIAVLVFFLALAFLAGNLVTSAEPQKLLFLVFILIAIVFGLVARVEYLIYFTFYVLLAASSFSYTIRAQSFYLRFGVLSLFLLRLLPLFKSQSNAKLQTLRPFKFTLTHLFILFYCGLTFLSTVYSINQFVTFQRAIALFILFGAVFIYLYWVTDTQEKMVKIVSAMVKCTIVLLMIGFSLYALGVEGAMQRTGRLRLFLFGPNELGYLCAILFPAAFWYFSEAKSVGQKVFSGVGVMLFVIALVMTASRGSLVCFAFSGLILVILAYRKRLLFWSMAIILVVSIAFIFKPPESDSLERVKESRIVRMETLGTGSGRLPIWRDAWFVAKQRPWFGWGFGTTGALFELGYFGRQNDEFQGGSIHNSYLEILVNLGWIGLVNFSAILFSIFFRGVKAIRSTWGLSEQRFISMIFCCAVAGVSSGIFESWLIAPGSIFSFPFWLCVALLLRFSLIDSYGFKGG